MKLRLRVIIFLSLIVPLYVVPSLFRSLWISAIATLIASIVVGFVTNNYWLGLFLFLITTAIQFTLVSSNHQSAAALLGDLIPSLVAIYFAQQLVINMGD